MVDIICGRCSYEWDYQGRRIYSTICSECHGRVLFRNENSNSIKEYSGSASPRRICVLRNVIDSLVEQLSQESSIDMATALIVANRIVASLDHALEHRHYKEYGPAFVAESVTDYWLDNQHEVERMLNDYVSEFARFAQQLGDRYMKYSSSARKNSSNR